MWVMKTMKNIFLLSVVAICACGSMAKPSLETAKTDNVIEAVTEDVEEKGTVFFDITLEQAFEKAKAEGKYVLVDFYTKTCGPCKKMLKVVFPAPECGEYVNKHFVPISLDGEDGGIGEEFAKKYDVFIFPTYLVLLPDGFREGMIQGAEYNVDNFLDMLKTIIHDK